MLIFPSQGYLLLHFVNRRLFYYQLACSFVLFKLQTCKLFSHVSFYYNFFPPPSNLFACAPALIQSFDSYLKKKLF